jgi:hypothetical protein
MQTERLIHQRCEPFLVTVQAGKAEDSKAKKEKPTDPDPKVQQLLEEFKTVFDDIPSGLPPDRGTPFTINIGDSQPVFRRGYRHTPRKGSKSKNK